LSRGNEVTKRGQSILVAKCANCHAIGNAGQSPLAKAPPFRDLHRKYDVTHLAEALAEGISTGHAEMPTFVFKPPEINAIIAYLKSLEPIGDQKKQ
jgi:cytochrome c